MWHKRRVVAQWSGLVCLVVVAGWVSGCGGDVLGIEGPSDSSTTIRTGGGSIPDGERVSGVVVSSYDSLPSLTRSVDSGGYVPARGASVTLEGPSGTLETRTTDADGRFAFGAPHFGRSFLRFDLNGNSNAADIQVRVKGGKRTEVVAGLVPDGYEAPAGRTNRVRISAADPWLQPGESVCVEASLQSIATRCPEIVWLMETRTDTSIVPTSDPNRLEVRAGSGVGWVEIQARLERAKSNKVWLFVGSR